MIAVALVFSGVALFVGVLLAARLTRSEPGIPDGPEPWARFAPIDEIERGRPRWWPPAGALAGLALLGSGIWIGLPSSPPVAMERASAHEPRPYLIEVPVTPPPTPTPTATPAPSPAPSATPATSARRTQPPAARPTSQPAAAPASAQQPAEQPRTDNRQGPSLSVRISCDDGALDVTYTVTARPGTALSSLSVSLDGRVVQQPSVSGRSSYSGGYSATVSDGAHDLGFTASGSDGATRHKHYPLAC